jgi:hypothetical protein
MESRNRNVSTEDVMGINEQVDSWIEEEQLPPRANFKVKKGFDPYEGMDEDEIEAYKTFRSWFVNKDLELLTIIPKQEKDDFYIAVEDDNSISYAFGSMDFQRLLPVFDKYQYKLKKIYERVKDLADTHSAISQEDGKKNTKEKYINLVETEFRETAVMLLETYQKYPHLVNRVKLMKRIAEINSRIRKCKDIWNKYAFLD